MELLTNLWNTYIVNVIDILIIAYIFYKILVSIRGTRANQIMVGLIILLVITILARDVIHLRALSWLLSKFWFSALIILAVVFQNELRSSLAKLGGNFLSYNKTLIKSNFIEEISKAAVTMSKSYTGALIAFEKEIGLKNYTDTGIAMEAQISRELILSIFNTKSPIHDGAIIISKEKIQAAGCVLPISSEIEARHLGTRHRAAIGLSSLSDAVVLVVSEETGNISIAHDGRIILVEKDDLLEKLSEFYLKKGE